MTRKEAWRRAKGYLYNSLSGEEADEIIKAIEQEPFINKPCVSSGMCEHDKQKVLDKLRVEIESLIYYWCEVNPRTVIDEVLDIIDKYKAESER